MNAFNGTWRLVRLALRRDRMVLPAWLVVITGLTGAVAASTPTLYSSLTERTETAVFSAANIAARVVDGPASGVHIGALTMLELYKFLAILAALMSFQAVLRHTRQNEDAGRTELLGSTSLGRHAQLTAAVLVAVSANIILIGTVTGALLMNDLDVEGSIISGVSVGAFGMLFVAIAAVAAQVMSTQREASTFVALVLGATFLLRAVGDASGKAEDDPTVLVSSWVTWLSPMGWGQQVRPFYQNNWDVFILFGAAVPVLIGLAYSLAHFRDIGEGMFSTRPGPLYAGVTLRGPIGLAWRLHRGALIGWGAGMVIAGVVFGAVADSIDDVVNMSDQFAQLLVPDQSDSDRLNFYFTFVVGVLAIVATGFTVQTLLRPRAEEVSGHLEPVLASATGRIRWLMSHLIVSVLGSVLVVCLLGIGGAAAYGAVKGELDAGTGMLTAAVVQIPAVVTVAAVVVMAFAFIPRSAPAVSWAVLIMCLVLSQFGELLELPQSVINMSPFTHVPKVPAEDMEWRPVSVLLGTAVVLTMVGLARFRGRNVSEG